jgi:hypothetical protein
MKNLSLEQSIKKLEHSIKKFGDPNNTKAKTLKALKSKLKKELKNNDNL